MLMIYFFKDGYNFLLIKIIFKQVKFFLRNIVVKNVFLDEFRVFKIYIFDNEKFLK